MDNNVDGGSWVPHVKGLGLGVVDPPSSTLVFLILMLSDHGGPIYN